MVIYPANEQRKIKVDEEQSERRNVLDLANYYLSDIGKFQLLSPEEERFLMKGIQKIRQEFVSCLLSHNESIKLILDVYHQNRSFIYKLSKFFNLANFKDLPIPSEKALEIFDKNIKAITTILGKNKIDYDRIRGISPEDEEEYDEVLSRIKKRVENAAKLINELGFNCISFFEEKHAHYGMVFDAIHHSDNFESIEERITSYSLGKEFLEFSSDTSELKAYLDNLMPLYEKYLSLRNKMWTANLRLVPRIVYNICGCLDLDAIEEGNLGLKRAIDGFDVDLGLKFSTYATYSIRTAIKDAQLAERGTSRHVNQTNCQIRRKFNEMNNVLGRNPTPEEVAEEIGVKISTVREALSRHRTYSLDAPLLRDKRGGDDFFIEPADKSGPVDYEKKVSEIREILKKAIADYLDNFLELKQDENTDKRSNRISFDEAMRNCRMLIMRYGLGDGQQEATLQEVADAFKVSRERVRQIIESLQDKLRPICALYGVEDYLPDVDEEIKQPVNLQDKFHRKKLIMNS